MDPATRLDVDPVVVATLGVVVTGDGVKNR